MAVVPEHYIMKTQGMVVIQSLEVLPQQVAEEEERVRAIQGRQVQTVEVGVPIGVLEVQEMMGTTEGKAAIVTLHVGRVEVEEQELLEKLELLTAMEVLAIIHQ